MPLNNICHNCFIIKLLFIQVRVLLHILHNYIDKIRSHAFMRRQENITSSYSLYTYPQRMWPNWIAPASHLNGPTTRLNSAAVQLDSTQFPLVGTDWLDSAEQLDRWVSILSRFLNCLGRYRGVPQQPQADQSLPFATPLAWHFYKYCWREMDTSPTLSISMMNWLLPAFFLTFFILAHFLKYSAQLNTFALRNMMNKEFV